MFYEKRSLINIILNRYGHQIFTKGMFNKCAPMIILNDYYSLDILNPSEVQCKPLEMVTSAR